jgi:hypothetical protein
VFREAVRVQAPDPAWIADEDCVVVARVPGTWWVLLT